METPPIQDKKHDSHSQQYQHGQHDFAEPFDFTDQLNSPTVIANPYPAYHQLREQSPLNYVFFPGGVAPGVDEPMRAWALMKYNDVYSALRNHTTFSSASNPLEEKIGPKLVLLTDDPPRHTRFRRLVNTAFTPKRLQALEPRITAIAHELLADLKPGQTDIVQSYAIPLATKVIASLIGIPEEEYDTFRRWSAATMAILGLEPQERAQRMQDMLAYFQRIVVTRRTHAAEDLITALVEAKVEGESLHDWEILGFCTLLLLAGNETTVNLVGNMLNILVDRPDLWQQLGQNRELVEPAIDETLRYESPAQRLLRVTTREVEVSGVRIPQGDAVMTFYGAANRDPTVFPNPDVFYLDRTPQNHVAFGKGIHYCLGAPLARAEAKITLNVLLDRFPRLERADLPAVRQIASPFVLGFQSLPLILTVETR